MFHEPKPDDINFPKTNFRGAFNDDFFVCTFFHFLPSGRYFSKKESVIYTRLIIKNM